MPPQVIIMSGKLKIFFKPRVSELDEAKNYRYAASVLTVNLLKLIKL